MSDSPELLVRKFFAAWANPEPDELGKFFHDAAVWVRSGADAITSELTAQLKAVGGATVDVKTLVAKAEPSWWNRSATPASVVTQYLTT